MSAAPPPSEGGSATPPLLHPRIAAMPCFSSAQLDAVARMRQAALESEGMIVGDSTGSGKGREAWGGILNAMAHDGGKRAVYVSKPGLWEDFKRDAKDCGFSYTVEEYD